MALNQKVDWFQNLISFTEEIVTYNKGGWVKHGCHIFIYP